MSRRWARETALHMVYGISVGQPPLTKDDVLQSLSEQGLKAFGDEYDHYEKDTDNSQFNYIAELVLGVCEKADELDNIINKYSKGWTTARMSKISLSILRIAMYEILYIEDISKSVSANEAVELAKKYDEPQSAAFINGILGGYLRESETT